MSEENKQTVEVVAEETAPALPTTEPPVEDPKPETTEVVAADADAAETTAAATEEAAKPEEKKKTGSGLKKRLTLKWGKNRDQAEQPKEPEAPADPRADVVAWIAQQIPVAVHKVNYQVLDWMQKVAVEEESARPAIPGKDGQTTRNQFLAHLRDGNLLVKLANKLQPGAIEAAVAEEGADAAKQKEIQQQNVEAFAAWAKAQLGGAEEEEAKSIMTAGDLLEKGKAGYAAVFDTLWNLGLKAQEKFEQENIDVDAVVQTVSNTVRTSIIGQIVAFFRRNRRAATEEKAEEKPVEEAAAAADETVNAAEQQQAEEVSDKPESAAAATTPAVAAN